MIWDFIIDHIPPVVWWTLGLAGGGALLYFFYPVLLPIWRMLPAPVKAVLVAAAAAAIAYLTGRYRGRADADEQERRRNAEALKKRTEVDSEVGNLSDKEARNRLHDRWTRPPT
jgi:membrane protein implicated in regulation of membrane protease activity